MISVDEALARILDGAWPLDEEAVPIDAAAGRVLAADLVARRTQPPFDASAMDGYAVRGADVAAIPARLRLLGAVGPGEAVRIFTGAPMPAGADTVVFSCSTTVSAPAGIGAPVKIRTASPGPTAPSKPWPAAAVPRRRRRAGMAATSAPRTA